MVATPGSGELLVNLTEVKEFLEHITMVDHSSRPSDDIRVECAYCSHDDYEYGQPDDLAGCVDKALQHLIRHHPENIVKPVSDDEIAEVFGLSPTAKTITQ